MPDTNHAEPRDLEQLYLRYSKMLYRLACNQLYARTGSATDASDIVQSVFVVASRKWEELKVHPNPGGWLVKVTYYVCANYIKAHYHQSEHTQHTIEQLLSHQPHSYGTLYTSAAEDSFAAVDIMLSLEQALSVEDYELLKSYCLADTPASEISSQTGRSETAIRVQMHRIREAIKKIFVILVTFLWFQNI